MFETLGRWKDTILHTDKVMAEERERGDFVKDTSIILLIIFLACVGAFFSHATLPFESHYPNPQPTFETKFSQAVLAIPAALIMTGVIVVFQLVLFAICRLLGANGKFKNQLHAFKVLVEPIGVLFVVLGFFIIQISSISPFLVPSLLALFLLLVCFPSYLWFQYRQLETLYGLGTAKSVFLTAIALPVWLLVIFIFPEIVFQFVFGGIG